MILKNKVIVITGASEGIGKEIAFKLSKENTKLALIARSKDKLENVANEAMKLGASDVKTYACDISQTDKLELTLKSIISDFETVDILINNAGIWQKLMAVDEIESDVVDKVIGTNLTGLIHTTRLLLPELRNRDEAAIINIVSKSGVLAQKGQSVYTASKYGVRGFTEVLKADLKETNVQVAGVYQSGTNTDMFKKSGDNFSTENFTDPSDLADVVVFMLSRPDKIWLHDIRVDK